MKTLLVVFVAVVAVAVVPIAQGSLLSGWFGVTLSVGGDGQFTASSWAPTLHTSTVDYIHENWTPDGPPIPSPGGWADGFGEQFDIEALYFDNDETYVFIAMVTSFHPGYLLPTELGYDHDRYIAPGDLALDLGGGTYQYGVDTGANTYGGSETGEIVTGGSWFLQNPTWAVSRPEMTNFSGGSSVGFATVNWYDYGMVENGYGTWVVEVTIDRSYLGNPGNGDAVGLQWTVGCRNDLQTLVADIDDQQPTPPIPEPATWLLFGLGIAVLAAIRYIRN